MLRRAIRQIKTQASRLTDGQLAFVVLTFLALTRIAFVGLPSLELVVGRTTDFLMATLCKVGVAHGVTVTQGILVSAGLLFVLAGFHLSKKLELTTQT